MPWGQGFRDDPAHTPRRPNLGIFGGTMLRILLCAETDARIDLRPTIVGRTGIEVFRAAKVEEVKLLASTLDPQLVMLDRDFPKALTFLAFLRKEPVTRKRSIAILARGSALPVEEALLGAGANALFRLPPDAGWDDRLSRLLRVPGRQEARLDVHIAVDTAPETAAEILNLSASGLFLATRAALSVGQDLTFRFTLPDGTRVEGRGRIARENRPVGYGIEFRQLRDEHREAIRQFLRSNRQA
jgi:CheY-like chemotaxis protein